MPKIITKLRLHLLKLFRENYWLLFSGHGVLYSQNVREASSFDLYIKAACLPGIKSSLSRSVQRVDSHNITTETVRRCWHAVDIYHSSSSCIGLYTAASNCVEADALLFRWTLSWPAAALGFRRHHQRDCSLSMVNRCRLRICHGDFLFSPALMQCPVLLCYTWTTEFHWYDTRR